MKIDLADSNKVFWKSIPLSLIRDERLTYASRAVAIHLLSMSTTWNFSATKLHEVLRVKSKNSEHLGRDLTKKIIKELEQHGYLLRTKKRLENGEWEWLTSFHPLCGIPYLDQKFSKKTSNAEATIDGQPVDGKGVDKSSSKGEFLRKKTLQPNSVFNKTTEPNEGVKNQWNETSSDDKFDSPEFDLSHPMLRHHQSIFLKVSTRFSQSVAPTIHQQIADELAGVLTQIQAGNHAEIRSKRAWILALFKSAKENEFLPEFASAIAKNRENQRIQKQRESDLNQQLDNPIRTPEAKAKQQECMSKIKEIMKSDNSKLT